MNYKDSCKENIYLVETASDKGQAGVKVYKIDINRKIMW